MSALAPVPSERRVDAVRPTRIVDVPNHDASIGFLARPKRSWWRAPWRVWVRRVHLWATLVVGLLLVAVTTSGAAVVLRPEVDRLLHADLYTASASPRPASIDSVIGAVAAAYPGNPIVNLNLPRRGESYEIELSDPALLVYVDPGSGAILGSRDPRADLLGWLAEFHTTLFAETALVPPFGWGLATTVLGISSLALLLMVVTGAVLWWPGIRRIVVKGFSVRWRRGAYATNHDLHKVIGFAALIPLMLWALTGVNFEYNEQVRPLWYALTSGDAPIDPPEETTTRPGSGPGIAAEEAVARALTALPGTRVRAVIPPAAETGYYAVWLATGIDPAEYGAYPGLIEVRIDPNGGDLLYAAPATFANATTDVYERWTYSIHTGQFAPWYVRLAWLAFGLAPLGLGITGVTMWWLRQRRGVRSKRTRAAGAAVPFPAD